MNNNYTDSGNSSPQSRETDLENQTPSLEDQTNLPPTHKVKLMVSYNGKIQPRSHDNLLSYLGGETKILSVDRSINFSTIHSKLASITSLPLDDLSNGGFSFKYQLPGEDLDSLISVTNDDDLEHMMHEYDRMFKASPSKPVRLRLFLFSLRQQKQPPSTAGSVFSSISSDHIKVDGVEPGTEPDRDYKITGLVDHPLESSPPLPVPVHNNVDYLFGLDNVPAPVHLLNEQRTVQEPELLQELNRLKIAALEFQQQNSAIKPPQNYENLLPANVQIPADYWHQNHQLQQPPQQMQQFHQQTPVYMMHAPPQGNIYAPPLINGLAQQNQGYYQVQNMPSDASYMMQQPVYSIPATMPAVSASAQVRQVAYDSVTGRQVYYSAPLHGGGSTTQFSGMSAVAVDGGSGGGKVVQIVAPPSSGV